MKLTRPKSARRPLTLASVLTRAIRIIAGVVVGLGVAAVLLAFINPSAVNAAYRALEQRWGEWLYSVDRPFADKLSIFVGDFVRDAGPDELDIPELVIDIPFKGMQKIFEKREEALRVGKLIQGGDDFVKGEIRADGRTVPVKLRLKGDWNDHLIGRKWSFRVHVRGGDHLYGMRRFSVQSPATRDMQAELLFFEAARRMGVMTPRYSFVQVTLNGDSMGVMALEESFGKELVESQRRREGVIVKFDESMVWESTDSLGSDDAGWGGAFDHYSNALIDSFASSQVAESPVLSKQFRVAVGMLRGFVAGDLSASEVFDAQQMGRLLAVADVFGTWHAVTWHNQRFYLNPITLRLEPIAYDATLQRRFRNNQSVLNDDPFLQQIIRDPKIFQAYQRGLKDLDALVQSGELTAELREVERVPLQILQTEFRMLGEYPLDYLQPRVEALLEIYGQGARVPENQLYQYGDREQYLYPLLARIRRLVGTDTIEITNVVPREVEVLAMEWISADEQQRVEVRPKELPLMLSARGVGRSPEQHLITVGPAPDESDWRLEALVRYRDRPWGSRVSAVESYAPLQEDPIPQNTVDNLLSQHDFLELDQATRTFFIPAGRYELRESLIMPAGYQLRAEAGVQLQFDAAAMLMVHGAMQIDGSAEQPVVFEGIGNGRWPGLVVMNASETSVLNYLTVRNTSAVVMDKWTLTGGVNFYASDVDVLNCRFEDSHGEDALNIIHSKFTISDTVIKGTASDAFDSDFSTGSVVASVFLDVGKAGGGDAVDVSGSQIEVRDSRFEAISDKALSVGEASEMTASGIDMEVVGTGAAAKDGSVLRLSNARINSASFAGLTAYIKKPEYGPARVEAENVSIAATETQALVQTGSVVMVDGAAVQTEDVDVDALYDTVMRKGLK